MSADTVCGNLKESRSLTFSEKLLLTLCCVDHCKRIVAVYLFRMKHVGIEAGAKSCGNIKAHCFAPGMAAHSVEIIEHVEQYGHSAVLILAVHAPKLCDLVHGGHIERFEHRASTKCAVA